ncbi:MAG: VCBS repeat-containing protein [Planctomycetaceae bacterium]
MPNRKFTPAVALILVGVFVTEWSIPAVQAQQAEVRLGDSYGFLPLEIFKLNQRSSNLLYGDFNNDQLTDFLAVDNSSSRIDLMQQRGAGQVDEQEVADDEANSVPSDRRFKHRKIPVDKAVSSLTSGDFNHDGRLDIAYFGLPDRLIIRYQPETGPWKKRKSFRLPDVPPAGWSVVGGDLNNDERDDIVVLGKTHTYVLYQTAQGEIPNPIRLFNTSEKISIAQIVDVDGDGRSDLCYRSDAENNPSFCVRFQDARGRLGPELSFEFPATRGISTHDLDGQPGSEILAIDARTGRIKVSQLKRPESKPGELAGRLIQYGFGGQSSKDRELATGDLDGDGRIDVVVSDPAAAQLIVFRQHHELGLDLGTTYPGLADTKSLRCADLDSDGKAEVVVLSTREKAIGISRMAEGRLKFPEPLTLPESEAPLEPVALELADADGDNDADIIYIAKIREGRTTKYQLRALALGPQGAWQPLKWGDQAFVNLELDGTPTRLQQVKSRDGRVGLLVFLGLGKPPQLLAVGAKQVPTPVKARGGGQFGNVAPGSVFVGGQSDTAVLVAQKTFARELLLDEKYQWNVVDQYNASESGARISGVAALNLDGKPGQEIVLIDSGVRKLRVLRKEASLFKDWREVELGNLSFNSSFVADLNGDNRDDLLLLGRGTFAVLYSGQTDPILTEIASFQTQLKNVFFADLTAGDLNGDGLQDVAVIDTRSHQIELLQYSAKHGLRHALNFKVFEEKSFSASGKSGAEPREAVIRDVTNDGRLDLLLLSHDRVLLYPQHDGK